jgi:Putative cell wall-binding domain
MPVAARRRAVALVLALCAMVGVVSGVGMAAPDAANAANGADFNAGNIISDAVFYNSAAMSAASIQTFLNSKVATCRSGYVCLKNYRQTTTSRAADARCSAYAGAANETAATIIAKVAVACGINPQVILVTLEKEEGLVTDDWPGSGQYQIAMGYGCPDSSGCDANYYGFFNQLYSAAHQFKVYRAYPTWFNFVAGRTQQIQYSPNTACGTKTVTIANQATAGLYDYTPYTPNAAALNNLYGVGDSCSTYGNRNFWRLFTDWFGSTQAVAVASQLQPLWTQTGGSSGALGYAIQAAVGYAGGGVGQAFQKGWAYWSAATGAYMTAGTIGRSYTVLLGPTGVLGYPIAVQKTEPGGALSQTFQDGALYTTPAGRIHRVANGILAPYLALGGPGGVLGYPTDSTGTAPLGGLWEPFDKGRIYWSPNTGAVNIPTAVLAAYDAAGGPDGALGYPILAQATGSDGVSRVQFENGTISWSATRSASATMRPAPSVVRDGGTDRYGTAVKVSQAAFPGTAPLVYVATGQQYPDALSAASAAAKQGGPLLLTPQGSLPTAVSDEIKRLKPTKVVVVGGTGAVSDAVVTALRSIAPAVVRIGGADRYATSLAVVKYAFGSSPSVWVATGNDFPDALSASSAAGIRGSATLLVDGNAATLDPLAAAAITALSPTSLYVVGGTGVVSPGIQTALASIAPTTRLSGTDRFGTNQAVAAAVATTAPSVVFATASDYPDALSGAVLSARRGAPMYLVPQTCIPRQAWIGLNRAGATSITVVGGTGVVGQGVASLTLCG